MPQITAIKLQKNRKFANVYIDNKFLVGVDLTLVSKKSLKVGKEISKNEIQNLVTKSTYSKLMNNSLRFIALRPRSEKELTFYLERKIGRSSSLENKGILIKKVIDKLKREKLIDDIGFANWWIDQRTRLRPKGNYIIYQELNFKGIDKDIIKELLSKRDEYEAAQVAYQSIKKLNIKDPKKRNKFISYLKRRGFSWEIIQRLVDEQKTKQ